MAETQRGFFVWLQDNARILLSIALVLFLLFAVYSYSKRTASTDVASEDGTVSDLSALSGDLDDLTLDADVTDIAIGDGTELAADGDVGALTGIGGGPTDDATAPVAMEEKIEQQPLVPVVEQQVDKQEGSIVVSAGNGDGMTHLARRATTEYMTANSIDYLSGAQRVYIEDYLQKAVPATRVYPGTSASFANDSIKEAIQKAQDLSEAELAALAHYANCITDFQ